MREANYQKRGAQPYFGKSLALLRGEQDPRSETGPLLPLGSLLAVSKPSPKALRAVLRSGPGSGTAAAGSARVAVPGTGRLRGMLPRMLGAGMGDRAARPCAGLAGQPPPASLMAGGTVGAGTARSGTEQTRASPGRVCVGAQSPGGAATATPGRPRSAAAGAGRAGLTLARGGSRPDPKGGSSPFPSLPFLPLPGSLFFAPLFFFSKFPGGFWCGAKLPKAEELQ